MIRRRLWASMLGLVVIATALLGFVLGTGRTPVLGLDLQGGVSVILRPVTSGASQTDLEVIRDLIRDELETKGIAEPDVRVEGSNVVVDLPGVKDQEEALDAADVSGIVTFRPVLQCGFGDPNESPTDSTEPAASTTTTVPPGPLAPPPTTVATTTTAPSGSTPDGSVPGSSGPDDTSPATTGAAGLGNPASFGDPAGRSRGVPPTTEDPASTATTTGGETTTTAAGETTTTTAAGATTTTVPGATTTTIPLDQPAVDQPELLRTLDGDSCFVGPPGGTGEIFERGSAGVLFDGQQGWVVTANLSGAGEVAWNTLANECFNGADTCPATGAGSDGTPRGQLAIVLDDVIQSAPVVNAAAFEEEVSISGMREGEARDLAGVIDRGAFPVEVEPATVQTVSPTLGKDSMRASVFAGLVGVALVLVMLVVFYRYLTLLVLAGMAVWGMLIFVASALISETTNYALTLAGVTGIIVSIGMTVDSYVIYFERLKDEVRHGRTLKNSATRSFSATWRTILAANLISAIGAAVLFVLSVGSVRGFALYLGVTTVCDVLVLWFFTRPAVILAAATGRLDRRNTFGLDTPAEAATP